MSVSCGCPKDAAEGCRNRCYCRGDYRSEYSQAIYGGSDIVSRIGKSGGGSLSGMAAMLGIGGMSLGSEADALNVSLFPDIVASTPFILELFNAHVTTLDGEVDTTFVAYLDEQKAPWWGAVMGIARGGYRRGEIVSSPIGKRKKGTGWILST